MAELSCPGCGQTMRPLALARTPLSPVTVDACDNCQALWLDATESQQLTPGALIDLFRAIGTSRRDARTAYPALLPCPRCTTPLSLTRDLRQTTRFTYYRCRYGHGRFTPYVQFLREKSFVRPLAPPEIERLRVSVATVRCASCGAPVPLERSAVCRYCGAPVMLLDADAVTTALARLDAAEAKRTAVPPTGSSDGDALIAIANVERELARSRHELEGDSGVDLIMAGIRGLRALLR